MEDHGLLSDAEQLKQAVEAGALKAFFAARGFVHPNVHEHDLQKVIGIICGIGAGINAVCQSVPGASFKPSEIDE